MSSGTAHVHPSCGSVAFPRASEYSDGHNPEHVRLIAGKVIASPESKVTRHGASMTTSANRAAGSTSIACVSCFHTNFPTQPLVCRLFLGQAPTTNLLHHHRPRTSFAADASTPLSRQPSSRDCPQRSVDRRQPAEWVPRRRRLFPTDGAKQLMMRAKSGECTCENSAVKQKYRIIHIMVPMSR
jgi:hypothetical protein